MIALTAAAVFAVLDNFAPNVGSGARQGAGFGIGYTMVGGSEDGAETFEDDVGEEFASSGSEEEEPDYMTE